MFWILCVIICDLVGLYKRWHWILWDRHALKGLLDDLFTHLPFPRRENAPVEGRDLVQFSPVFLAPVMVHGTQNMADKCFSVRLKYPPANFWTDFFFSISSFPSDSPHCCLTLVLISQRAQLWQGTKRLPHCQIQDSLLSPHTHEVVVMTEFDDDHFLLLPMTFLWFPTPLSPGWRFTSSFFPKAIPSAQSPLNLRVSQDFMLGPLTLLLAFFLSNTLSPSVFITSALL